MAQSPIDNKSEAFRIIQDNMSSSRGRDVNADEVEKSIKGNKNLLKIYKEIEASLKKSGDLYAQNRKSLDYINKLNKDTFKTLKNDAVTRKQINDLNRQNIRYLDETQDLVRESLRNDIDSEKIKVKIGKLNNEIAKSERARVVQSEKVKDSYEDVFDLMKKNEKHFKLASGTNINTLIDEVKELDEAGREGFAKLSKATTAIEKATILKEIEKIDRKQKDLFDYIDAQVVVEKKDGTHDKKKSDKLRSQLDTILSEAFSESSVGKTFSLSENILHETVEELAKQQIRAEKSEKQIGTIGKIFDGLSHTPLQSLVDFKQAKSRMKDANSLGQSPGMSALKSIGGSTPLAQVGVYGGIALAVTEIIKLMAKADDRVTRIARSFGIAKLETGGLYRRIQDVNTKMGDIGVNIDDIIDAQINFNTEFGYAVNLSDTMLKNIGQSTKLIGLSTESTNELIRQSLVSKKEINQIEGEILGQLSYQSKGLLGNKVMMEKVLNITGNIRANFKGNVSDITKAIVKAKEYGTTLEKINHIGDSMLDWESSISSELEAELITGRQINIEKARYAALMGNTAELMEEINKNVGNFDQFTNMNVLQQQSFAKALGMTREEMTNMLFEQQVNAKIIAIGNNKFDEEQRHALTQNHKFKQEYSRIMADGSMNEKAKILELGEIMRNNISQMSAQQKFEAVLEKIKERIAQLFGDGAVLDKIADGLIGFMNTLGIIGDNEEKRYLAQKIIKVTNPEISETSEQYKNMFSKLSELDVHSLKNKSDIISLEAVTDKASPEYKKIREKVVKENRGTFDLNMNSTRDGLLSQDAVDQIVKAIEKSGDKPVSLDGILMTSHFKQNGLVK